jgi:hypothetical protein
MNVHAHSAKRIRSVVCKGWVVEPFIFESPWLVWDGRDTRASTWEFKIRRCGPGNWLLHFDGLLPKFLFAYSETFFDPPPADSKEFLFGQQPVEVQPGSWLVSRSSASEANRKCMYGLREVQW